MRRFLMAIIACLACQFVIAGDVDTISIASTIMKKNIPCIIIKPDSYKNTGTSYPVVYLLHGYGGSYTQWISLAPQLKNKVDELQIIIVCPDGGFNSWYFDSPIDSTVRLRNFCKPGSNSICRQKLPDGSRQKTSRNFRIEHGGHGGLYLSIKHKDIYGAAGSISGGVDIRPFPNNWDIKKKLGDSICCTANWDKNTVINLAGTLKNADLTLIMDCGVQIFY